jgi:hypothetical protein
MTVAATFARRAGFRWVACASTGNTSASMAAYAARGGLRSLVLVPEGKISWSKLSQALDYGAVTCQLRTDFDGCLQTPAGTRPASPRLPTEFDQSRSVWKARKLSRSNCSNNSTGSRPTTSSSPAAISATVRPSARRCSRCVTWA